MSFCQKICCLALLCLRKRLTITYGIIAVLSSVSSHLDIEWLLIPEEGRRRERRLSEISFIHMTFQTRIPLFLASDSLALWVIVCFFASSSSEWSESMGELISRVVSLFESVHPHLFAVVSRILEDHHQNDLCFSVLVFEVRTPGLWTHAYSLTGL